MRAARSPVPATEEHGPAMGKSPQAFRTISEVSELLDIPAHVLRFWESRFPQIRPIKSSGGRRYYRPEDVDLLRGIRELLYDDGLTIKGVQKVLREQGAGAVVGRGLAARGNAVAEAGNLLADAVPGEAGEIDAEAIWDDAEYDGLVEAAPEAAGSPAAPAPGAAPGRPIPPERRRAMVADAVARLEAVRSRILAALDG